MCGIVGVVSLNKGSDKIALDSLRKLEYRGYDSFGFVNEALSPKKHIGAISKTNFQEDLDARSKVTIAHTRWATHGVVNLENTHPHCSMDKSFFVVHNGVISNYAHWKRILGACGYKFYGDTDTEIVANLLHFLSLTYDTPMLILRELRNCLEGEYALCMYSPKIWGERIYVMKKKSPLVFGHSEDLAIVSSDPSALSPHFSTYVDLQDNEILCISEDSLSISIQLFLNRESMDFSNRYLTIDVLESDDGTGCGSAYYAAEIGLYLRHMYSPSSVTMCVQADEIERRIDLSTIKNLVCISQSGETYDTLEPARAVIEYGNRVIGVTNVKTSALAKLSTFPVIQNAGVERCVLSTKSIVSQCAALYKMFTQRDDLFSFSNVWNETFTKDLLDKIEAYAFDFLGKDHFFHIGRGVFYPIALENALKLKEVTYCHAEGMGAGFFKHGTLSLIDDRFVTFAHLPLRDHDEELYDLTLANIAEIKSRWGKVVTVGHDSSCDICLPNTHRYLNPLLHLGVGQYFAYYLAIAMGRDVDQPRSLAKSVTVR
jgi:glucosamine--fructose-6-phosphate aminotransferase (isomerizing)